MVTQSHTDQGTLGDGWGTEDALGEVLGWSKHRDGVREDVVGQPDEFLILWWNF